jgi:hypothetical protein
LYENYLTSTNFLSAPLGYDMTSMDGSGGAASVESGQDQDVTVIHGFVLSYFLPLQVIRTLAAKGDRRLDSIFE